MNTALASTHVNYFHVVVVISSLQFSCEIGVNSRYCDPFWNNCDQHHLWAMTSKSSKTRSMIIYRNQVFITKPLLNKCKDHLCVHVLSHFSHVWLFETLWTVSYQAPLTMGSPDKNTGVGCHALLQGIFSTQGLNPHLSCLLHWQAGSLPLVGSPTGSLVVMNY